MTFSLLFSMSLFALVASLSPGPINLISLSSSARHGLKTGLLFVTGASIGFVLLFLLIGLGLHYFINALPWVIQILQWLGISFLLYLSYKLFTDDGSLKENSHNKAPTFMTGAIMQWINPKAWLASVSGIAAYIPNAKAVEVLAFAGLYLPICWLSLGVWVGVGILLGQYFQSPRKMRWLNKSLAVLLAGSSLMTLI